MPIRSRAALSLIDAVRRLMSPQPLPASDAKLLDILLDSLDVAVVACGTDGRPTHLNRRAVELMAMDGSGDTDPGTWIGQVLPRRPDGTRLALCELPIVRALEGEIVRDFDLLVRTPRGDALMTTTACPVLDEHGLCLGAVAVFADVTAQRAHEATIQDELHTLGLARVMRDALDDGRLLMYAQPIVELCSSDIVLDELLLRISRRDGSILGPAELLAAAERQGSIAPIDEWVFSQAAAIAGRGRAVTVNVSAQSIVRPAFIRFAEAALERTSAKPGLITFEITETAVVSDIVGAARFADRLGRLGCNFALDDFGTGYAALTYLKHLPITYLKLDRDFVRDLMRNGRSRAVVTGVVALAQGFGLRTIGEGVEDEDTLALLAELGVDMAQGFHVGVPAPLADAVALPDPPPATARAPLVEPGAKLAEARTTRGSADHVAVG
jgi:EAL domain-containing protein (putative c-di-GMP-specific phosphodiesterase class I)